jgi:hypothetical protein
MDRGDITPKNTPMSRTWKHDPEAGKLDSEVKAAYRSTLMKISYLAQKTRPDLAFSVNKLSRYQSDPNMSDMKGLIRILRYLIATRDYGLFYQKDTFQKPSKLKNGKYLIRDADSVPVCYADASYGEEDDRSSRTGYVVLFGNAAISWQSKKQTVVAISSTEAELYALSEATKEALWFRHLMSASGIVGPGYIKIYQDNTSAISIAKNPLHPNRVKHMDVRHRFVNQEIDKKTIVLVECNTKEMIADILTKPLSPKDHEKFTKSLGLYSLEQISRPQKL